MARADRFWGAIALGLVGSVSVWLIFANLGRESLLGDEAIYAAVARDSARSGSWLPLEYDGKPYTGKPPLGIWAIRLSFALLGVDELSARLPSALAGLAALAVFAIWSARRTRAWTAALAGGLLVTGHHLLFRHGLRQGVLEGPLLLGMVVAVVALAEVGRSRFAAPAAALACAFGAAIKGGAGPVLLAATAIPYVVLAGPEERPRLARTALWALAAGVTVWGATLLALASAGIGNLWATLWTDVVERATTGIDPGHLAGPWFYPALLGRELGAWLLFAPLAFLRSTKPLEPEARRLQRRTRDLALAWALGPMLVLSLSVSKLSWYLYPALPGWALLIALGVERLAERLPAGRLTAALLVFALALGLCGRLVTRAARITTARPEQVTLRVLADALRADPRAVLVLDRERTPSDAPIREWHWFYLGDPRPPVEGLQTPLPADRCSVVVTDRPEALRERLALPSMRAVDVYRVTATERPLAVLDGCDGRYAARLRAVRSPAPTPDSSE